MPSQYRVKRVVLLPKNGPKIVLWYVDISRGFYWAGLRGYLTRAEALREKRRLEKSTHAP